ncbi:MAG: Asp-tRNA(Asn)/Glu-tRNA(Gln) amidotransferase subunit GatC [Proteobacteria bacterium]|nr:Asp-tRNA(Asn)/Glu-tRNA(Gln) amidotransferase subunit GatC [Pseudomonadota bacterium]
MKIQAEEIRKVAHLARLELSEKESQQLTGDMNNVLGYIDKLAELETENVEPTSHAVPATNAFREDICRDFFSAEEGLSNAPDSEDGSFKVPKVIE